MQIIEEPVGDLTHNCKNYATDGGDRLVIGGTLEVLDTATVTGLQTGSASTDQAGSVYQAPNEQSGLYALEEFENKWAKYPKIAQSWKQNWDAISPIFKFSAEVRKVIYTTNAIESLNATYRKLNRQRSVFPSATALLKALYLSTFEATKKWTMPLRNWGQVYGELSIMYEGRLPE